MLRLRLTATVHLLLAGMGRWLIIAQIHRGHHLLIKRLPCGSLFPLRKIFANLAVKKKLAPQTSF